MRYQIEFDGLTVLDVGRSTPSITIDHEAIGTPPAFDGSAVDFLVRHHPRLRSLALDMILQQHVQLFVYEDGAEARQILEILLGDAGAVAVTPGQANPEPFMVGDALRLELIIKAPEIKLTDLTPVALTEFAIIEMIRNAYRRLRQVEQPTGKWFFQVFMQTGQPTQIPLGILHDAAIVGRQPSKSEALKIMQENPSFWKAELQELGNAYLAATCHDPALMTLQNAALYQRVKSFFQEGEE